MQVKYNNQWHEVKTVLVDGVTRELTPDKIEDVRTAKGKISLNKLLEAHSLLCYTIGIVSGALTELDEDLSKLDKKYEDDTTEN